MPDTGDSRRTVIVAGHSGDTNIAREHLGDADPEVRAAALGALARIGELESDELVAGLSDESAIVRRRAVTLAATRVDGDLLPLLSDTDLSVIETTAWSCGERPLDPVIVDRLVELVLHHDEPLCREAAVAALGSLEAEAGLSAIIAACTDKPQIRRRAVLALSPFDTPEASDALHAALEDRDWQVRQAAEELLEIETDETDEDDAETS